VSNYHLRRRRRDHRNPAAALKPDRCLACGYVCDSALPMSPGAVPQPGYVTICVNCGHIMAFDRYLSFRPLTDAEMHAVAGDRQIIMAQRAIAEMRKKVK
jgi:hypothetical protein